MINHWVSFFGNEFNTIDCDSSNRHQFTLTGGFTKIEYGENANGECKESNMYSGNWKITDNKLTITATSLAYNGNEYEKEFTFEIDELSETVLTLKVKLDPNVLDGGAIKYRFYYFEK